MKTLLFATFSIYSAIAYSQLNYRKMKDTICPTYCGFLDSITLIERYTKLLDLDTNQISKGMAVYYEDLSHLQYDLHLLNGNDSTLMALSLRNTEKSIYHNPKNERMLWNTALIYTSLGDCEKAHRYLNQYWKVCPKKYWKEEGMHQQISMLLKRCPSEELQRKFKIGISE